MQVLETFFTVSVRDMRRAVAFYGSALGANVMFESPGFTSLRIAGVRVGLALDAAHEEARTGLHFAVRDIPAASAEIERAGGRIVAPRLEPVPGVVLAEVADTEANTFTLTQAAK